MSIQQVKPTGSPERGRVLLLVAAAVSVLMWYLPGVDYLIFPFKVFVTIVHEGCHGIATVLTGGIVRDIAINPDGSGVTMSGGGDSPIITMAGYLGSAICGALVLQLVRRKGGGSLALAVMGTAVLAITLLWVRNPFGLAAGLLISASIWGCLRIPAEPVREFLGSFLCVQLCLNALFDVRDLVYLTTRTNVPNDAVFMTERAGMTPEFWAVIWAASAVVILFVALRAFWAPARSARKSPSASS